ncbi:hypothetical protein CRD60_04130 [Bifidobacterium aemilianum]|uniref:Uncharacterized protein n=1 Tax=Bifidobacterium aemilianum TaxID=2493120 RepID=A0A366KAU7_9BIFI|nr:hypothetical protein CRD60_04130 [Bifidobacterium aemilianum]
MGLESGMHPIRGWSRFARASQGWSGVDCQVGAVLAPGRRELAVSLLGAPSVLGESPVLGAGGSWVGGSDGVCGACAGGAGLAWSVGVGFVVELRGLAWLLSLTGLAVEGWLVVSEIPTGGGGHICCVGQTGHQRDGDDGRTAEKNAQHVSLVSF